MTHPLPRTVFLGAIVGALTACSPPSGARLHLTLPARIQADRVVVSAFVDDDAVFEELQFPDTPRSLDEEEDLVVLLDDALAGEDVVLVLVAKDGEAARADASASFDVEGGGIVDVDVEFALGKKKSNAVVVIAPDPVVGEGEGEGEEGEGEGEGEGGGNGHGHGHGHDDAG